MIIYFCQLDSRVFLLAKKAPEKGRFLTIFGGRAAYHLKA